MSSPRRPPVRQWVRAQCDNLRAHLLARKRVTEEQIREAWPRKGAPVSEWIRLYGTLRAWIYEEATGVTARGAAEEQVLEALRETPERVRLLDGTTVDVHPKGLDALLWCRARGWLCEWLAARLEALRQAAADGTLERLEVPEPVATMEQIEHELAWQLGAIAAVVTHPGPDGGPYMDPQADIPERWVNVNPLDLYRIHAAFQKVNAVRLEALQRVAKPQRVGGAEAPMSWNVFLSSLAMRLNEDPANLARNRSLVGLLATVRLARDAEPDAPEVPR